MLIMLSEKEFMHIEIVVTIMENIRPVLSSYFDEQYMIYGEYTNSSMLRKSLILRTSTCMYVLYWRSVHMNMQTDPTVSFIEYMYQDFITVNLFKRGN